METDPPNLGSPLATWHGHRRDGEGAAGSGEEVILLQKKKRCRGQQKQDGPALLIPHPAVPSVGNLLPGPRWRQDTVSPTWRVSPSIQTLYEALFLSGGDFRAVAQLSAPKQSYKKAERDLRLIQHIPPSEESRFSRGDRAEVSEPEPSPAESKLPRALPAGRAAPRVHGKGARPRGARSIAQVKRSSPVRKTGHRLREWRRGPLPAFSGDPK